MPKESYLKQALFWGQNSDKRGDTIQKFHRRQIVNCVQEVWTN